MVELISSNQEVLAVFAGEPVLSLSKMNVLPKVLVLLIPTKLWLQKLLTGTFDHYTNKYNMAYVVSKTTNDPMSCLMRKPTICTGENKESDQLRVKPRS